MGTFIWQTNHTFSDSPRITKKKKLEGPKSNLEGCFSVRRKRCSDLGFREVRETTTTTTKPFESQTSWGRLELKPSRSKGSGT